MELSVRHVKDGEVRDRLLELSVLHTNAMAEEPWCEVWSNDLEGVDPRTNSPEMFRKLLSEKTDFFLAENFAGNVVGIGVGMLLSCSYLTSMEWGRAKDVYTPRAPEVGDYEMNLVIVHPDHRQNGLMSKLVDARMEAAKSRLSHGRRIWVQTIPRSQKDNGTNKVVSRYETLGFQESGRLRIKETERIFLSFEV